MRENIIRFVLGGIVLIAIVSALSLTSVSAQEAVEPWDLPPRSTPDLNPRVEQKQDPPSLSIHIQSDQTQAQVGDVVEFTITLTNLGKTKTNGIKIIGLMPPIFDIVNATTSTGIVNFKAETGRVQVNNISPLYPNTSVTVTVLVRVNALAEEGAKHYTAAKVVYSDRFNSAGKFSNWLRIDIGGE